MCRMRRKKQCLYSLILILAVVSFFHFLGYYIKTSQAGTSRQCNSKVSMMGLETNQNSREDIEIQPTPSTLEWRSELTTRHKGSTFCGVTYSKEMAIFNQSSIKALPQFKNPCWYNDRGVFSCFPYFFIIGSPKTGTSDLYHRLVQHPQYIQPETKEPNWFSQKIFTEKMKLNQFVEKYYRRASNQILQASKDSVGNDTVIPLITGDASTTYIFYHDFWPIMPGNLNKTEPVFTNADYIHHFNPNAKIIASVRNPIERVWSGFLYVSKGPKSADIFHDAVVTAVKTYKECFANRTTRSCVYDKLLYLRSSSVPVKYDPQWKCPLNLLGSQLSVHLRTSMYAPFLQDYFKVFPRQHILIQRLEDRAKDMEHSMREIFRFLEMDDPTTEEMKKMMNLAKANVRSSRNKLVGEMREDTRRILFDFFKPFNEELARLAGDEKFNYGIR